MDKPLPPSIEAIIDGWRRQPMTIRNMAREVAAEACRLQRAADLKRQAQYHQIDGTPLEVPGAH